MIVLFTLMGCEFCENLKKTLKDLDIKFNEIEVNLNPDIWSKVTDQIGEDISLPSIYLMDDDDSGDLYIPGIHFSNRNEAIEIINDYLANKS